MRRHHVDSISCSACDGDGWYYVGGWSQDYPKRTCAVCRGTGRMVWDRTRYVGAPQLCSLDRHAEISGAMPRP